jgi:quinoprotein glucose dehydrogenase
MRKQEKENGISKRYITTYGIMTFLLPQSCHNKKEWKRNRSVAQTSKVGFLYVLDRETGEPLYPVEETSVPASDVPGEEAWPTQPYVLKPEPYAKQFITASELTNFTPESHDSAVQYFNSLRYDGLFTPPSVKGTFVYPGTIGGS